MSDKDNDQDPLATEEESTPADEPAEATIDESVEGPVDAPVQEPEDEPAEEKPAKPPRQRSGNPVAWLAFLAAIIALAAAGYVAWNDWRTPADTGIDDELARVENRLEALVQERYDEVDNRLTGLAGQDSGVDAELAALRQDVDERIRLLSSLPARISTLESSVASLAGVSEGARDAWVIAESEYYMQIANAQLQLANNPHLAALALKLAQYLYIRESQEENPIFLLDDALDNLDETRRRTIVNLLQSDAVGQ